MNIKEHSRVSHALFCVYINTYIATKGKDNAKTEDNKRTSYRKIWIS